jgi:hypothetical protein
MLVLLVFLVPALVFLGIAILAWVKYFDGFFPALAAAIFFILFTFALVSIPLNRRTNREYMVQYYATQDTLSVARAKPVTSDIERAAILQEIITINQQLAEVRYNNKSLWWDWYIVDELAALPPLE